MAVTRLQRWIIDWLLHNSMLHCKNSRPGVFLLTFFFHPFNKNEVKVSINLERTIWLPTGNQSWSHASCWCRTTRAHSRVTAAWTRHLIYPFNDSNLSSLLLSWKTHGPHLWFFFFPCFWCLFSLRWHVREEAPQLHVSYHCTFCNKFISVQIWPRGTPTLNTKCAL